MPGILAGPSSFFFIHYRAYLYRNAECTPRFTLCPCPYFSPPKPICYVEKAPSPLLFTLMTSKPYARRETWRSLKVRINGGPADGGIPDATSCPYSVFAGKHSDRRGFVIHGTCISARDQAHSVFCLL